MRREYLSLGIIITILIALNVMLDTFPIEGILTLGCVIGLMLYLGNLRTRFKKLEDKVSELESNVEDKEKKE